MSISQNYPLTSPSLSLDFANTKVLDSRITFSRPTDAVYYDGKTVTKAEENLHIWSQEFDNAYWIKFSAIVTANTTTAPDGTTTAKTLTATAGGSVIPYVYNFTSLPANITFTASIFVKKNTHDFCQIWLSNGGVESYANFDLATGVLGNAGAGVTNHVITSVGNDWYRCSFTFLSANSNAGLGISLIGSATATRIQAFTTVGTESIYIWGAQLEARSTVTAYTPTTTQAITNYTPTLLTAPSNVARFDHNPVTSESLGLLVEEQRTNLLTYSEDFSNAVWTKTNSSLTSDTIVAPDGALTGDKLVENTATGLHGLTLLGAGTITSVLSIYAKSSERSVIALGNASFGEYARFDLATGSVISSGTGSISNAFITDGGNGWYRCSCLYTYSGVARSLGVLINGSSSYTGDGYSGIYIWGAQLEAGAFPTSYIKTQASQVTRSSDSASMTGANFSDWYRADEGSVYAEYDYFGNNIASYAVAFLETANTANRWYLLANNTTNRAQFVMRPNGVVQAEMAGSLNVSINTMTKVVATYKTNDFAFSQNALAVATDVSGYVTNNIDQVKFGKSENNSVFLNGHIKKLSYYSQRLSNENLQALTS